MKRGREGSQVISVNPTHPPTLPICKVSPWVPPYTHTPNLQSEPLGFPLQQSRNAYVPDTKDERASCKEGPEVVPDGSSREGARCQA